MENLERRFLSNQLSDREFLNKAQSKIKEAALDPTRAVDQVANALSNMEGTANMEFGQFPRGAEGDRAATTAAFSKTKTNFVNTSRRRRNFMADATSDFVAAHSASSGA